MEFEQDGATLVSSDEQDGATLVSSDSVETIWWDVATGARKDKVAGQLACSKAEIGRYIVAQPGTGPPIGFRNPRGCE